MTAEPIAFSTAWKDICIPRLGVANLTRQAFQGVDLYPLWTRLMGSVTDDVAGSGMGIDLAMIAQLRGDKETGLAIQDEVLRLQQLFRPDRELDSSRLRVLAFASASDIGANMPIEFLLEGSAVDLAIYYVVPGMPFPNPMPAHDVAIVLAPATPDGEITLAAVDSIVSSWPCPILNTPTAIKMLERDRLYRLLSGIPELNVPATVRISRNNLGEIAARAAPLEDILRDGEFPIIIRPLGSHAGFGLAKIDSPDKIGAYLGERPEKEFFISRYIDYASADGLFRKYRIVVIGGKPYACHMAIADEWKVWYLNADMALSVPNRIEEGEFMLFFDETFGARHRGALTAMADRIGLDYFTVDCAETTAGTLLIFEADHTAIVHDMDPPNVYPYKPPQMRKLFGAFVEMLHERSALSRSCAA